MSRGRQVEAECLRATIVRVMDALVEHRAAIPVDEVEEMHDELLAGAAGLAVAFKLGN